jgi:AraC family transcriptional regulator
MRALAADLEDGSPVGPLYGESLGVALAHYLIRRFAVRKTHSAEPQGGMPGARLNRVKDFIQQNCAKESRLWELAQVAGMSPHYFCKLFKESVGLSPHQYVIRCRIKRAKEFLRDRRFTVNQVAEVTGFADQTHFTKVFHRLVGVTPMQFRRLA